MSKKVWTGIVLLIMLCPLAGWSQRAQAAWVDSVMQTLDVSAKIGQLIVVPVNGSEDFDKTAHAIHTFRIGGVVFTQGNPTESSRQLRLWQSQSEVPLLAGINADEGTGAVFDSLVLMPPPLLLGAIANDSLIYHEAREIGRQLRLMGFQFGFGPGVDLSRSFDDDALMVHTYGNIKENTAAKALAFMRGLQSSGIIPVAKFYSNNTVVVSGFKKGVAQFNLQPDPDKLYPVQHLIRSGLPAILCANRQDPIFRSKRRMLMTTRKKKLSLAVPSLYTADYLKRELKFNGLVFSYTPDEKSGLTRKLRNGAGEVAALAAGNDILLFPDKIGAAVRRLKKEVSRSTSLQKQLDQSVRKILAAKYDATVFKPVPEEDNLLDQLNSPTAMLLQEEGYQQAITVLRDTVHLLPIVTLDNLTIASLTIGAPARNTFTEYLSRYTSVQTLEWMLEKDSAAVEAQAAQADMLIVGVFPLASNFEQTYSSVLARLASKTKLIVVHFGPPSRLSVVDQHTTLVAAYLDDAPLQKAAAQVIFGALPATASLPLTINDNLRAGMQQPTQAIGRVRYALPESVGVDGSLLSKINNIAREAINEKATPGCQVVVIRKGAVILDKSYGWQTYDNQTPIDHETIYDLASITKVAATLQGTMFLYERGLIDLNKKASVYLPELRQSNKRDIIIKDILTHQAGLWPFVPFWVQTLKDSVLMPEYYSTTRSDAYPYQVAPHLFASQVMRDSIWSWTVKSKLREKPIRTPYNYTYSDIGLYIMHRMNETLMNQPQEDFLQQNLYEPLGASTMGYLPLARFDVTRIAPTENDRIFRKELLVGTAHDEGAAMNGGTAGHAGLFSNALDLAKLGQMLLQKGYYGGHQYFRPETIELFTHKQYETSRRGLGWDKPVQSDWNTPTSRYASPATFGHTGFTGTCIWIDPEFDLVFVFLSNRVYPTREGNKLSTLNIRSRMQDAIYEAVFGYCQYQNLNVWNK